MTISRVSALLLGFVVAGSLSAQDKTVRTLTTEGITFKLPAGWDWQSEIASNIAIKKDIKIKDQTYTITADMVYATEGFLEDTISGIEKKVAVSKGDLKDYKVARGEKFNGVPAVIVSLTRVRGEKHDQFEDERNYIFRRTNALYTWTERNDRIVGSQASGAFSPARNAVTFTKKDTSRLPKTWDDVGIKYVLPADFEYEKVTEAPQAGKAESLFSIESVVTIKGSSWRIGVRLVAEKYAGTLDDVEKQVKELLTKNFKDVKEYQLLEKQDLKGEKAIVAGFTGIYVPDQPAAEQPRTRLKVLFCKRKGYLLRWIEQTPEATNPVLEGLLKKARDGLSWF